jgi:hypothetical protein
MYPQDHTSEGDTPPFLHLINSDLESRTDYTLGLRGGRCHGRIPVSVLIGAFLANWEFSQFIKENHFSLIKKSI